ncbi:hypothetical protein RRG08_024469 [Elysia crispata]|uniref:Uncharacterized protein n=1 Tax=Elysia crispata TaxID=231223 RepID=A0AAE1D2B6_9GAST|nr:hypothetical protein RRG08_024469 [Elysia crispata]
MDRPQTRRCKATSSEHLGTLSTEILAKPAVLIPAPEHHPPSVWCGCPTAHLIRWLFQVRYTLATRPARPALSLSCVSSGPDSASP